MAISTKASNETTDVAEEKPPRKRAPTLYLIILFKLAKAVLAFGFSTALYFQSAKVLLVEYQKLISEPVVKKVFHYLRVHPENKFFTTLAADIAKVTDAGVREAALGALLFALFPLTEAMGLLFRVKWAGWLAIVESAFFVPLETRRLLEEFSWFMVGVTIINIGIVWYLYANRERLFYQHHSEPRNA